VPGRIGSVRRRAVGDVHDRQVHEARKHRPAGEDLIVRMGHDDHHALVDQGPRG